MWAGEYQRIYDPSVGEAERWYVNDHTFVRDHTGTWHLIGITHAEPFAPHDEKHLAHATAPDLHGPWTKQPFALSTDPDAGETHLWAPHVVAHDDRYWMFYCAGGAAPTAYRLHLAVSDDCWTWTRHPANPLVVDGYEARDPMVLRLGDRWVMYYTATSAPEGGNFVVKAVVTDDLVRWGDERVVYADPLSGTFGGGTESPFVVEHGGRYHLLIGPDWPPLLRAWEAHERPDLSAYRRTRVLASDDPFHFTPGDEVATLASHAAEIIVDDGVDGSRWWVSHCGWGMGGVHLAPLHWDTAPR
jgi:arabinan endo-1,5-alpha-L-arabinosidase